MTSDLKNQQEHLEAMHPNYNAGVYKQETDMNNDVRVEDMVIEPAY